MPINIKQRSLIMAEELEIKLLGLNALSAAELLKQQEETGAVVERCGGAEVLNIVKPFDAWKVGLEGLRIAIKVMRGSLITDEIADCDKECGTAYRAIKNGIKTALKHFDPKVVKSAKRVDAHLNTYGNITDEPLDEQMALSGRFLANLDDNYAEDIEIIGIGEWVERFREKTNELIRLNSGRIDEDAKKSTLSLKSSRKNIEKLYRNLCTVISANVIVEGVEKYKDFIITLNAANAKFGGGSRATTTKPTTPVEPTTPTEPVEETHEEKMAKARAFTQINEGEWKNGDYCWHLVNSVKTYWKLLDATQKETKPYFSGGEAVWEKVS
jgi:hypothetical protein